MLRDSDRFGVIDLFLPLAIIVTFCFDYQQDVHWPPWCLFAWILTTICTFKVLNNKAKPIPATGALLFGWVLAQGIAFMEWRPLTQGFPLDQKASIRLVAAHTMVEFLLLVGVFYTQWPRIRRPLAWGLFLGGLLHTVLLIIDQTAPALFPQVPPILFATKGLLGNRSIGATFTASWFFFALHLSTPPDPVKITPKKRAWICLLSLLAIPAVLISVSSISFGALALGSVAVIVAFATRDSLVPAMAVAGSLGILLGLVGPYIDPEWSKHISRYDAWPMFFWWHWENTNMFLGAGAGSFKFYGPHIQEAYQYMQGRWWLWAHNDWLQILFEYGVIGLTLSLAFFLALLKKAWDRPALLGAVVCFGASMLGNYPIHIAMSSLLGFWLTFETMWGDKYVEHR